MAQATIYAHPVSYLSWRSSSSTVTSGSINNNGQLTCTKGAVNKKWDFSNSSGGTAQVTLTITAGGGG